MTVYDYDLGVLGGGAAGLTVAAGAARLGARTLLVEKEPELGGDCLHFGCVPSKTLIRTARLCHQLREAPRYGLPQITLPPVDFREVRARIRRVIATIQRHDSPERFRRLGAEVAFGSPRFSDEHTIDLEGRPVTARAWVIATGSSPALPPLPGLAETSCLTNRELFSLEQLPETLLILGGGAIAIEMAQAFRRLGSRVTLLQRGPQILSREDQDLAAVVQAKLEAEGVVFHLGCRVLAVSDLGDRRQVRFTTPDGRELAVSGSALLVALGRTANTAGLGLEGLGIAHDPGGIQVDRRLRTTHRHIFAAGDVIGGHLHTHAAGYEGGIVVSNAVLRLPRRADYTWMPHCTYTGPELASLGHNEKSARAAGLEYRVWREDFSANDRALTEGEEEGRIKLLLGNGGRPLGVQILGPRAGELLGEWVAALNGGLKLSTLAGAVHPYPTLGEINKKVAAAVYAEKLFSDRLRTALRLFFGYRGHLPPPDGS